MENRLLDSLIREGKTWPVILADCPWTFKTYSAKGEGKSPSKHYKTMSIEDIEALPVSKVAANDSILFMWCYQPLLPEALKVMAAWGFDYKSIAFVWVKKTKHNKYHISTGYYTRAGMEMVLLGRRGNPPRVADKGVRQVFESKVRLHSQKPDETYDFIERLYDGPYLELFSRSGYRKNWTKVGDEVGKLS